MIMFDNKTVSKYIDSLVESYLFYRVKRSPRFGFLTYIVGKKVRTMEGFTQYIQEPFYDTIAIFIQLYLCKSYFKHT